MVKFEYKKGNKMTKTGEKHNTSNPYFYKSNTKPAINQKSFKIAYKVALFTSCVAFIIFVTNALELHRLENAPHDGDILWGFSQGILCIITGFILFISVPTAIFSKIILINKNSSLISRKTFYIIFLIIAAVLIILIARQYIDTAMTVQRVQEARGYK